MTNRSEIILDAETSTLIGNKSRGELSAIVGNNSMRKTEPADDILPNKFQVAWTVMVANASASTYRVKYSTATMINLRCLVARRNGPRMSIPHRSNDQALAMLILSYGGILNRLLAF